MFSVLLKSLCRTKLANTSAARPKTPRSLESWQLLAAFEPGMLLDRFPALILEEQMCWWNWIACYHTSATTPMWWKYSSWSSFIPTFIILISISTSTPTFLCSLFKELYKKRPEAVCPSQDPGSFSFHDIMILILENMFSSDLRLFIPLCPKSFRSGLRSRLLSTTCSRLVSTQLMSDFLHFDFFHPFHQWHVSFHWHHLR